MNSLPESVTRQRRGCDLNPGFSAPESSTLTTRLPSHPECRQSSYWHFESLAIAEVFLSHGRPALRSLGVSCEGHKAVRAWTAYRRCVLTASFAI